MNDLPRPSATAITSSASTTHSGSIEMPRQSITPKISARYTTLPTTISRGLRAVARSTSACADNNYCCNLDRYREGQCVGAERGARMPARVAEHFDQQDGGAVDHLRLIAEVIGREHETNQLRDLLDVVEPGGCFHLGEEVERACARR